MIHDFLTNQIFVSAALAGILCHIWKFIDSSIRSKKLDWYAFIATGGMPSSHATFVCALAVSVGFIEGFLSSIFFVTLGFTIVVVRDAFGVRHTVDALTKNVNEIIRTKKLGVHEIMKITGHTPVQTAVGVVFGTVIAVGLNFLVF